MRKIVLFEATAAAAIRSFGSRSPSAMSSPTRFNNSPVASSNKSFRSDLSCGASGHADDFSNCATLLDGDLIEICNHTDEQYLEFNGLVGAIVEKVPN